jgi:hypothetical protein
MHRRRSARNYMASSQLQPRFLVRWYTRSPVRGSASCAPFGDLPQSPVSQARRGHVRRLDANGASQAVHRSGGVVPGRLPIATSQPGQLVDELVKPVVLKELHGVKGDIALTPDLENRHNIGVMQSRRGLRLATGLLQRVAVPHHVVGREL